MAVTSGVLTNVGMAEMRVSGNWGEVLVTHGLGSCLGIAIHDPVAGVGGMLHTMLPDSTIDAQKGTENPFIFVDTGVPKLFWDCYNLGAEKSRLVVKIAGGASSKAGLGSDCFRIGERNLQALCELFRKNGVAVHAQDVGGGHARTFSLEIGTGEVLVKVNGVARRL